MAYRRLLFFPVFRGRGGLDAHVQSYDLVSPRTARRINMMGIVGTVLCRSVTLCLP